MKTPLDYQPVPATPAPDKSARFWAGSFLLSGGVALLCIPILFVLEHFRSSEIEVHLTTFGACILCATSAAFYLARTRRMRGVSGAKRSGRTLRLLAYVAVVLAGGFLLLLAVFMLLAVLMPSPF